MFDLLAPAFIKEASKRRNQIESYRKPDRFGQGFKYSSTGQLMIASDSTVAKSQQILARQLRISTTDVSELKKRQSTRTDLDRQRYVIFTKSLETNRSQTFDFFHNRIWPSLHLGIHNPWVAPVAQQRYFILNSSEEHLFSRRRRRLTIDPHGDGQKASSYALFAREGNALSTTTENQLTHTSLPETEKLLESVSVNDAMKQQSADDDVLDVRDDNANSVAEEGDGWEEEDNEWDEMARARDAAARVAVRTRRSSKSKRRASSSPSIASRFSRVSSVSSGGERTSVETILCRDDRVVFVRPTMSAKGSVVLTNRAIIFNPEVNIASKAGDTNAKPTNEQLQKQRNILNRKRRWRIENIRRMYLRRYCLVNCAFELFVNGGEVVFFVFKGDPQVERRDKYFEAPQGQQSLHLPPF